MKPVEVWTVKIVDIQKAPNDPLLNSHQGTLIHEGELKEFTTDRDDMVRGEMYKVGIGRSESIPGEPPVVIHDIDQRFGKVDISIDSPE